METAGPNAEQIDYWNQQAGPKWVNLQSFLDDQLGPLGITAMDRLEPLLGKSVLDVGCGCGDTSLDLARRVGSSGSVLGIDLSQPMLARARERAGENGFDQVSFEQADAQCHEFPRRFDAAFSRFGVMFFADPVAAFANIRHTMVKGGKLSFICWRSIDHNEWMMVPLRAALQHLPMPELPAADAPGPFAFADDSRVERILGDAGFSNPQVVQHDVSMTVGAGRPIAEVAEIVARVGPAGRLLSEASEELVERVVGAVREALEPYDKDGVRMQASAWLVSATA